MAVRARVLAPKTSDEIDSVPGCQWVEDEAGRGGNSATNPNKTKTIKIDSVVKDQNFPAREPSVNILPPLRYLNS